MADAPSVNWKLTSYSGTICFIEADCYDKIKRLKYWSQYQYFRRDEPLGHRVAGFILDTKYAWAIKS